MLRGPAEQLRPGLLLGGAGLAIQRFAGPQQGHGGVSAVSVHAHDAGHGVGVGGGNGRGQRDFGLGVKGGVAPLAVGVDQGLNELVSQVRAREPWRVLIVADVGVGLRADGHVLYVNLSVVGDELLRQGGGVGVPADALLVLGHPQQHLRPAAVAVGTGLSLPKQCAHADIVPAAIGDGHVRPVQHLTRAFGQRGLIAPPGRGPGPEQVCKGLLGPARIEGVHAA